MKVLYSKEMGFCSGVQGAVDLLEKGIEQGRREQRPVYTIGPLIHNEQYLASLEGRGVKIIHAPEDTAPGIAVVRAHGISRELKDRLLQSGFSLIDGTCGRVKRSQKLVEEATKEGKTVLIVGDKQHGEIISLQGFSLPPGDVQVISDVGDLSGFAGAERILLIAQTTFSREVFNRVFEHLEQQKKQYGIEQLEVIDTICPATSQRQEALEELVAHVDAVVVIGGKHSSNTKRLYEYVQRMGKQVWLISNADEVHGEMTSVERVGITAGASTPTWVIDRVVKQLTEGGSSGA